MLKAIIYFLKEVYLQIVNVIKEEDKLHIFTVTAIMITGIFLRVYHLFMPARYDESFSFTVYGSRSLEVILSDYSYPNNHIFHSLLVSMATSLFGKELWAVRLPALISGIILIIAVYIFTRIFFNKYSALLAMALAASSGQLVSFSVNARGYIIIALASTFLFILVPYLLEDKKGGAWLIFTIISAAGFYAVPVMLYPFIIIFFWISTITLLKEKKNKRNEILKRLIIYSMVTLVLTTVLYSPILLNTGLESIIANKFVKSLSWTEFTEKLPQSLYTLWNEWNNNIPLPVSYIITFGFFVSLFFFKKINKYGFSIILTTFITITPILLIQKVAPYTRVWLFLLPLYFSISAAGIIYILRLNNKKAGKVINIIINLTALSLSIWLGANLIINQTIFKEPELKEAKEITLFLKDYFKEGDRLFARCPSDAPLSYYFHMNNISDDFITEDLEECRRVIIVINKKAGQSLEFMLYNMGYSPYVYEQPVPVKKIGAAEIYEVKKSQ